MTYYDQVHEALESAAKPAKPRRSMFDGSDIAEKADIKLYRDDIVRFLDEIEDDGLSVRELREALDEYK